MTPLRNQLFIRPSFRVKTRDIHRQPMYEYRMLNINEARVVMIEIEALRLFWTIEPTSEELSDYAFSIMRSGAQEGPFELLAESVPNFEYADTSVNNYSN